MKWIILPFLIASSCQWLEIYPDNPIEEAVEEFVEDETGIKIDLSGKSPEIL